jgi:hypothetical protein
MSPEAPLAAMTALRHYHFARRAALAQSPGLSGHKFISTSSGNSYRSASIPHAGSTDRLYGWLHLWTQGVSDEGVVAMGVDDILIAIIIGGMLLSGVYLRAQYATRRSLRTAELRKELGLRELYGTRLKTQDSPKNPEKGASDAVLDRVTRSTAPEAGLSRNSLPVRVRFAYYSPSHGASHASKPNRSQAAQTGPLTDS